ncbi:MAG: virulence factor [Gemmatimonadetes bacterium]|nr:virulence factor [Gemmatimonadota bacterium]
MAEYQVLYWKDIPAQVRVFDGKRRVARQMPPEFQEAIDRCAMAEGLAGTDAYLEHWHWSERRDRPGDPQTVLLAVADELERTYDDQGGDE